MYTAHQDKVQRYGCSSSGAVSREPAQASWFEVSPNGISRAFPTSQAISNVTPADWTEDTIVCLHFMLLDDIRKLADPATPIAEKFEIMRWIYTDPAHDAAPFSFANCLKLFGHSTHPGFGVLSVADVRDELRQPIRTWICESLARYPAWVREAFLDSPEWIDMLLARNPQRLNEATRVRASFGDLFLEQRELPDA